MVSFGSTLGRTNFPCYYDKDGYHTLPRPYAEFKPKVSKPSNISKSKSDKDGPLPITTIVFLVINNKDQFGSYLNEC